MARGYRPCVRRPLILAAVLAGLAAAPAGAQAAVGWLQAPQLAADGALRGAGVRGDGVAQVVFGAGTSELSVQRPFGRAWQAPVASELPPGLTAVVQNASGDRIGWTRTPGGELVVSSRGTASRRDDGSWSAPLTLATGVRAAAVALNDYREGVAAWVGTRRRGLRGAARPVRGVGRAEAARASRGDDRPPGPRARRERRRPRRVGARRGRAPAGSGWRPARHRS